MEGINTLLGRIYGVRIKYDRVRRGEVWADYVHKLTVHHETVGFLGVIYCDFSNRAGKVGGDCHFTVRCAKRLKDGSFQTPIVVLSLFLEEQSRFGASGQERTGSAPTLLSPGQAENLFHEMGHAIHSMLARTRYQHVAGTRCSTDLAEVPSNLMEYFFYDPRVLCRVAARNYRTGDPLPWEMAENLCGSRFALSAVELQQQALYGLFDLNLHSGPPPSLGTTELFRSLHNEIMPYPHVDGTGWQHRFGHLVPYGAKYYSYLVAKATAALIWQRVFKGDPFSRHEGLKWMRAQSFGGERPTKWVLKEILGFTPEPMHLVEALHKECA